MRSRAWAAAEERDEEFALQTVGAVRALLPAAIAEAQDRLKAASAGEIITTLTPILVLCGAAGLNESDREEWLIAAADALKEVPLDLLKIAAREVAKRADHPSKIVASINEEVSAELTRRRRALGNLTFLKRIGSGAEQFVPPKYWRPKEGETDAILREVGFERAPGSVPVKRHDGPPRMPTREDYIALGVDPSVLDRLDTERVG